MKTYTGEILDYVNDTVVIRLPCDAQRTIRQQKANQVEVRIQDGRYISVSQRRKIYATMHDIGEYMGEFMEYVKDLTKYNFCMKYDVDWFSLSECDMSVAREFLSYLIDFCIEQGIPTSEPLNERTEDIGRYIYKCIEERVCAITGLPNAAIHHYDRIGMRSRNNICHVGMRVMPLSPEWHDKVHMENEDEIYKAYHIYPIPLDAYLVKKMQIGKIEVN